MRAIFATLAVLIAAPPLRADVVVLLNGDRITGRVVSKTTRRVRLQTPYGALAIPSDKVERILRDDGREELLNATPPPAPAPPPPPPPVRLVLAVSGQAFWQAWDPKAAPLDPSLRLEVRLDDRVIASYTDVNLDPEDLPKTIVNSFVFSPERLFVDAGESFAASAPVVDSGEIRLPIAVPAALAGWRQVRLAYQVNDAGSAAPSWRDVVHAEGEVLLAAGSAALLRVRQDRGSMDYARRAMRYVETFHVTLQAEPAAP